MARSERGLAGSGTMNRKAAARPRVSVIGTSDLAVAAALKLSETEQFDVILCDPSADAFGSRRGLYWSGPLRGHRATVRTSSDPQATAGSEVLVLAPGTGDRDRSVQSLAADLESVLPHSEDPVLVVATDCSNALCQFAESVSGVPRHRIIGTGTLPDSARLRTMIARELGISVRGVQAVALGETGDRAVPLVRFATAAGVPVLDLFKSHRVNGLVERFRGEGHHPAGAASQYAQASAIVRIVNIVSVGPADLVPCSVMLDGEYGIEDAFLSVPAVLGPEGVERIVELDLSIDELVPLRELASTPESFRVPEAGLERTVVVH